MLATHEPASPSAVISSSNHIQNQIKEHVSLRFTLQSNRIHRVQKLNFSRSGLLIKY